MILPALLSLSLLVRLIAAANNTSTQKITAGITSSTKPLTYTFKIEQYEMTSKAVNAALMKRKACKKIAKNTAVYECRDGSVYIYNIGLHHTNLKLDYETIVLLPVFRGHIFLYNRENVDVKELKCDDDTSSNCRVVSPEWGKKPVSVFHCDQPCSKAERVALAVKQNIYGEMVKCTKQKNITLTCLKDVDQTNAIWSEIYGPGYEKSLADAVSVTVASNFSFYIRCMVQSNGISCIRHYLFRCNRNGFQLEKYIFYKNISTNNINKNCAAFKRMKNLYHCRNDTIIIYYNESTDHSKIEFLEKSHWQQLPQYGNGIFFYNKQETRKKSLFCSINGKRCNTIHLRLGKRRVNQVHCGPPCNKVIGVALRLEQNMNPHVDLCLEGTQINLRCLENTSLTADWWKVTKKGVRVELGDWHTLDVTVDKHTTIECAVYMSETGYEYKRKFTFKCSIGNGISANAVLLVSVSLTKILNF